MAFRQNNPRRAPQNRGTTYALRGMLLVVSTFPLPAEIPFQRGPRIAVLMKDVRRCALLDSIMVTKHSLFDGLVWVWKASYHFRDSLKDSRKTCFNTFVNEVIIKVNLFRPKALS